MSATLQYRDCYTVANDEVETWFVSSGIRIGTQLTAEEALRAKRMLFTWKDVFEKDLLRIKQTDLIEHAIILTSDAQYEPGFLSIAKRKSPSVRGYFQRWKKLD